MKYVDEYRNARLAKKLSSFIGEKVKTSTRTYSIMEVCGTHTNTFFRFGLKSLLPEAIRLISGPGCPVCVTEALYIDNAVSLARMKDVIVATYGDMVKVPGSRSSLYYEKARGCDIRVVYSATDALRIAEASPSKKVVFLAVGFETTAPTVAMTLLEAKKKGIDNFFVYVAHKQIPPALRHLLKDRSLGINGFILPAHVSTIIGVEPYSFLQKHRIPCVIAGFEPLDMLQGMAMLVEQIISERPRVEIQYDRVVKREGNRKAQQMLRKVFVSVDAHWRGLGAIPRSGYALRREFSAFDAERFFELKKRGNTQREPRGCLCGNVLKGKNVPTDCSLFGRACTPDKPVGPCMVSSEGSCSVYYKYRG